MGSSSLLTFVITTLLLVLDPAIASGLYSKHSPVIQIDAKNYETIIAKSNYTSILEFYAPWCGHCQNLKPAYEKAAKNLQGLAKVAAINCDEESNKPLCGSMGIQGFPTLKIIRPGKKSGRPVVEDYNGQRATKAIVDAVVGKIPNHVKRLKDEDFESWLQEKNGSAKAILFTDKGTTSALLRALAIDYLGSISFAQIRNKEEDAVETFGISKFPTFVLLPGGDKDALVYDGEMKKASMSEFLMQVAEPNPDSAGEAEKPRTKASKKPAKSSDTTESSSSHHPKAEHTPSTQVDELPDLIDIDQESVLNEECFAPKSHICILALLPNNDETQPIAAMDAAQALLSLGQVHKKHSKRQSLFPFYSVPPRNPQAKVIRDALELKGENELEIIAVNAKRSWWRRYSGSDYSHDSIEAWIDVIRMNEGAREKLPDSLIVDGSSSAADDTKEAPKIIVDEDEAAPSDIEQEPIDVEFKQFSDEVVEEDDEPEPIDREHEHDEL